MKKKNVKSKFDFVKIDVRRIEVAEEIKKVKNIIQRFLITYQWPKKYDTFSRQFISYLICLSAINLINDIEIIKKNIQAKGIKGMKRLNYQN